LPRQPHTAQHLPKHQRIGTQLDEVAQIAPTHRLQGQPAGMDSMRAAENSAL
jgi:hypothetical protein